MQTILVALVLALCIFNVISSPVQKSENESHYESREEKFITGEELDEHAKLIETTTFDYFEINSEPESDGQQNKSDSKDETSSVQSKVENFLHYIEKVDVEKVSFKTPEITTTKYLELIEHRDTYSTTVAVSTDNEQTYSTSTLTSTTTAIMELDGLEINTDDEEESILTTTRIRSVNNARNLDSAILIDNTEKQLAYNRGMELNHNFVYPFIFSFILVIFL